MKNIIEISYVFLGCGISYQNTIHDKKDSNYSYSYKPFFMFSYLHNVTDFIYVRDKFSKRKNQSQIDIGFVLKVQN